MILRNDPKHHEKAWFNIVLRSAALVMGAGMGFLMMPTLVGLGIGLAGGVMNATIVTVAKARLKKIVGDASAGEDTKL